MNNLANPDSSSSLSLRAERVVEEARRLFSAAVAVSDDSEAGRIVEAFWRDDFVKAGFTSEAAELFAAAPRLLRALLASQEAAPSVQWQPIETYVDSSDPVLVAEWDPVVGYYVVEAWYSAEHDKWWELNSVDDGAPGSDRRVYPTHWMPLPSPPAQEGSPR